MKNKAVWIGAVIGAIIGLIFFLLGLIIGLKVQPVIFIIGFTLLGGLLGLIASIKRKNIWILYFLLLLIAVISLFLTIKWGAPQVLLIFAPLLLLITLHIFLCKSFFGNTVTRGTIILGGIIGWIWGLISIYAGALLLERDVTFIKILFVLPVYLSRNIFGKPLFVSLSPTIGSIIGLIIGLTIALIILELKRKNEIK
ncbi:MAG: hypothetical protein ABIH25_02660 [Candidatus Woesearchaeota archaeon]